MKRVVISMTNLILLCFITAVTGCTNGPAPNVIINEFDGIDISHHNGTINWNTVATCVNKNTFIYIKCTEGATYTDKTYRCNAENAKKLGYKIGGYHYFRMTSSAHDQFNNFKKSLSYINQDLIPMVDVETTDGHDKAEVQDSLKVFLTLIENEFGKKPMIYGTNSSYNKICAPLFNEYPLYIARYGDKKPIIIGKSHYTIWQYSESGTVDGIEKSVDFCRFYPGKTIKDIIL